MAKLKSLKIKSKEYVFTSFENDRDDVPGKIVFSRFPMPGESFSPVTNKNLFEGVDAASIGNRETQNIIAEKIIDSFMSNLKSGIIDYRRFTGECVDHIENLEYQDSQIKTPSDFWQILPAEAAYMIAEELYRYATVRDEFTMGESNA
jgi:hypothetical protein